MSKRHKLNCNSRAGKYVKVAAIADNGSNKESNLDNDKHTLKGTKFSIPNKSEKLELKCIPLPEKNMKVQSNDCQNVAIFTNEHALNNLSSCGDTIITALESKKDVAKENIQKIKDSTKQRSSKLPNEQNTFTLKNDKKAQSKKKIYIQKNTTRNYVEEEIQHSTLSRLDRGKENGF